MDRGKFINKSLVSIPAPSYWQKWSKFRSLSIILVNVDNAWFLTRKSVLAEWFVALDPGSFALEDAGSNPRVPNCSVWDGGQWRDSVSLAGVDPAPNGYLEQTGEGKQEGCVKAQDGWPPTPHYTSWLKGQRNGDQKRC